MKKTFKIPLWVLILFVFVFVGLFQYFNNSNSTFTNFISAKLENLTAGETTGGVSSPTTYYDWSDITTMPKDYSYCCIFQSPNTEYRIIQHDATATEKTYTLSNGQTVTFPAITDLKTGDSFKYLITNCAVDKNGELLDVVVESVYINTWEDSNMYSFVSFEPYFTATINSQINPPGSRPGYDANFGGNGDLITFLLEAHKADCELKINYYKHGTYNETTNTGTYGDITSLNSFLYDLDIPGTYNDKIFGGTEGYAPSTGTSKIYYNKNHNNLSNKNVNLLELENGIAVDPSSGDFGVVNGIWYKTSALISTSGINGAYSFKYGGTGCGILFSFASPYPYEIEKPTKSINTTKTEFTKGDTFTYKISQYIPNNYYGNAINFSQVYDNLYGNTRFKKFIIEDDISTHFTINESGITVTDESGANHTSKFTITVQNNHVKAEAKTETFDSSSFYSHRYTINVPVTVKSSGVNVKTIPNKGTSTSSFDLDKDDIVNDTNIVNVNIYYNLIVNHLEKGTNTPLVAKTTTKKYPGDNYTTSASSSVPSNYRLVATPTNSTGTITDKDVEVTYYYEPLTEVNYTIEYYYDNVKDTTLTKTASGYVGDTITTYTQQPKTNYSFDKVENLPLTLTDNPSNNVIKVYYSSNKSTVTTHHYLENTTTKLAEDVVTQGNIGSNYTTSASTTISPKYELVSEPTNKNGTYTNDPIEVIYYYKLKTGNVVVKHLEKDTNAVLKPQETKTGNIDSTYSTSPAQITNYEKVSNTNNTSGTYTLASVTTPIEVIYYYSQKTKVTINHIDKVTGEILDTVTENGLVGNKYTASSRDFDGYILVEKPEQETVTMTKDEIVLNYYYNHVSAGVIEKHVDEITNDILYNETHSGNENDPYEISSKTFENYDLVEEKLPTNNKGTMSKDVITVTYYYKHRANVNVKYVDILTGKEIIDNKKLSGHVGDDYSSTPETIENYELVQEELPSNANGKMTKDTINVTYYYKQKANVNVKYIDVLTGKEIIDNKIISGYVGDDYSSSPEIIDNYELVKEELPKNSEGKMTKENIEIIYKYIKKSSGVEINHIDINTNEKIAPTEEILGNVSDEYTSKEKTIEGYDVVTDKYPENNSGKMTEEKIVVNYYYKKKAKVIAKYIDKDSSLELTSSIEHTGYVKDEYSTDKKDFEYYNLVEEPENAKGTFVENSDNNILYVNYYYVKKTFNLKLDKQIASIIVNGTEKNINKDLSKQEINKKEIQSTNLKIKYSLVVTNNGEISGSTTIKENIPSGMKFNKEDNQNWNEEGENLTLITEEIMPGESKTYYITFEWKNSEENFGAKENNAELINELNAANFEDINPADNKDNSTMIIAISTGGTTFMYISLIAFGVFSVLALSIIIKVKNKNK